MKTLVLIICIALFSVSVVPTPLRAQANRGHHQSGITGHVTGGLLSATPDGQGSMVIPNHIRVHSDTGELVAEVETEVQGDILWHFEVFLKPGSYTVLAYAGAAPGPLSTFPVEAVVEKKQSTEIVLSFRPQ